MLLLFMTAWISSDVLAPEVGARVGLITNIVEHTVAFTRGSHPAEINVIRCFQTPNAQCIFRTVRVIICRYFLSLALNMLFTGQESDLSQN